VFSVRQVCGKTAAGGSRRKTAGRRVTLSAAANGKVAAQAGMRNPETAENPQIRFEATRTNEPER